MLAMHFERRILTMSGESTELATDGFGSLVQYDISFQKRTPLLGTPSFTLGHETSRGKETSAGIHETLEEEVDWDPSVDKADRLDYLVAAASGVISGFIDTLWVGEFSLDRASGWGEDKVERFVIRVARSEGYNGDDLAGAIRKLEKNHPFAADGNANAFGGGLQHHLRDFSHHFGIDGVFFSIFTQFTGLVVGTDLSGALRVVPVPKSNRSFIGKNFQEKLAFGTIGWFFHMVSDMAGSGGSLMGGTGIPGPIVSLIKDVSALPFFRGTAAEEPGLRLWVSKLFNGTLLADHDENGRIVKGSARKFDLRTEIGMLEEIGRQALPVLVNQCVVRGFYFCRRAAREIRDLDIHGVAELGRIAPEDILPWGTPAMRRMVTVSSGIFVGVDIADAAVRSIASRDPVKFFLRVNYVGIAAFTVACVVDVRATLENESSTPGEGPEETYERGLADLGCLKLDFMQARILHSIEHAIVAYDIAEEGHPKRAAGKRAWLKEWSNQVVDAVSLVWAADAGYFLPDDTLYAKIGSRLGDGKDASWLWLVAMEAGRFRPYGPLHCNDDGEYKGLKLCSDYLNDVFCIRQDVIGTKELADLEHAVDGARARLDGSRGRLVAGVACSAIIVAATGGIAAYFAPTIAPTLAAALGLEASALHGAALASASLAFLGGGAIAAGGAGMAGGTMLIAGGGALLGAAGGTGLTAATSLALSTDGRYVLEECSKLEAFCQTVLLDRNHGVRSVSSIYARLCRRIVELEAESESIRLAIPGEEKDPHGKDGTEEGMPANDMFKAINRTIKVMCKCRNDLAAALGETNQEFSLLPLSTR